MLGENFAVGELIAKHSDVLFWTLILLNIVIFTIIATVKENYLKILFNTIIFNRYLVYNSQDSLQLNRGISLLFTLSYFTSLGALAARFTNLGEGHVLLLMAGLLLTAFIKLGIIALIGFIANTKNGVTEHALNHHLFFQITSFILTLFLLFTYAVPDSYQLYMFTSVAVIIGMSIIFREIQSLIRAINSKISVFYIILYLCTLEILPVMVMIRVIASENAVLN